MADQVFRPQAFEDVEDAGLSEADSMLQREGEMDKTLGDATQQVSIEAERDMDTCPFDMGISQPRAISLLKLCELCAQPVPAQIAATVGTSRCPFLLIHQVTPFSKFGYPPTRVWGLGYQVDNLDAGLVPVDFAPRSEFLEVGGWATDMKLGVAADGSFSLDP